MGEAVEERMAQLERVQHLNEVEEVEVLLGACCAIICLLSRGLSVLRVRSLAALSSLLPRQPMGDDSSDVNSCPDASLR